MSSGSENVVKAPKGIMHLALVICILLGIFVYAGWRIKNREKFETANKSVAAQEHSATVAVPAAPATVMTDLTAATNPAQPVSPASAMPTLPLPAAAADSSASTAQASDLLAQLPGLPVAPAAGAEKPAMDTSGPSLSAVATTSTGAALPVADSRVSPTAFKQIEHKVAAVSEKLKSDPVASGQKVETSKMAAKPVKVAIAKQPEKMTHKSTALPVAASTVRTSERSRNKTMVVRKPVPVVEKAPVRMTKTVVVEKKPVVKLPQASAVAKTGENGKEKENKDTKEKGEGLYYVVAPGDSLSSIAEKFLGTRARAREVYEQNRTQIGTPDQLKVGMKLHLPGAVKEDAPLVHVVRESDSLPSLAVRYYGSSSAEVIGLLRKANPALQHGGFKSGMKLVVPARTIVNTEPGAAKGDGDNKIYVVKPGDSLRKIANVLYHDEERWTEIYEANKKAIRNPENLYVGTKLDLPN